MPTCAVDESGREWHISNNARFIFEMIGFAFLAAAIAELSSVNCTVASLAYAGKVLCGGAVAFALAAVGLPDAPSVLLVLMSGAGTYIGNIIQMGASAKAGMYGMQRVAVITLLTEGIIEMGYIMSIGVDA